MKRNRLGIYLLFSSLVIIAIVGVVEAPHKQVEEIISPKPVTLVFVGDIMMDRGVKSSVLKNMEGDYNNLFLNTGYLKNTDIAFANLEGTVALGGNNVGSRFSFHMNPIVVGALKNAGFDIVSFANNHVGDWNRKAFDESLQHLRENNILYTGAGENYTEVTSPRIIDVRGMKIGFLGATDVGPNWLKATETDPGILIASDSNLPNIVSEAKKQVDILVVSLHWGIEYSPVNSHQESLAHTLIDNGADIIVGTHPHVMERVEIYKDKPIFYSLGNFIFDQYFSPHTLQGMVAHVSIDPETYAISTTQEVSPISKLFVPQVLIPFSTDMLVTKTFTP